jgi:TonB family protein
VKPTRDPDYIPVAYLYPQKEPFRWKRIHTSLVIALIINVAVLIVLGWYAGAFAEETIYEVNLVNVIKNDGELKPEKAPKRLTLDPARVPTRKRGAPAGPAPAPGHKPENVHAKAPPKLKIDAPQVAPDQGPPDEDPSMVNNPPPPPDASLNGNPEGVAGGRGNEEGPGGNGTGGTGTGGDGNGSGGGGGRMAQLVNRVNCLGCHQSDGTTNAGGVEPDQIEKLFNSIRWKPGGTAHPLTLTVTINDQGYVKDAQVMISSGRADVDESAIELIKMSKWKNPSGADVTVEMPFDVYF